MTPKVCLDLFSGLGGFSAAFADSDEWDVVTVDVEERFDPDICSDVMDLRPSDFEREFDVVLVGHPCTLFSTAGNHDEWDTDTKQPTGDRARDHVAMLYHTLGLVSGLSPKYWYLENPRRSRARWFIGPPKRWVSYCQYGMDYQKDTGLWGEHSPGMNYEKCQQNGCHKSNTEDDGYSAIQSMPSDSGERAKVPYALSEAIREATDAALAGDVREQVTTDYFVDRKN